MNPTTDPLSWLSRADGHQAWVLVYALIAAPMLVGLIRAKASGHKLALFPILAFPITALAVIFVAMLRDSLATLAPALRDHQRV